jgi:uncharacterized protein (TIGR02588 family)
MRRNLLEWLALGASALAIALVAGYLVIDGLTGSSAAPQPTVSLHESAGRETELGWSVPATLTNTGGEAAEAVVVEATAQVAGKQETSEYEVDFLPSRSEVEIEFGFSARPDGAIEVRLIGFRRP